MKFALLAFAMIPSLASASVSLVSSQDTAFKACLRDQVAQGIHASAIEFLNSEVVTAYPAYAETHLTATFASEPGKTYQYYLLLKTDDVMGWSNIQSFGAPGISAASVQPNPVLRNDIGKDVITLDLANCAL